MRVLWDLKDNGQPLLQILWNVEKARNIANILEAFATVRERVIPSQNTQNKVQERIVKQEIKWHKKC